ncbi:MAG: DUF3854 domain-containing protein [Bacteroidetes bacterium]|nr:DUF3854 domain-containing protein [Bacteroidota bacterium]
MHLVREAHSFLIEHVQDRIPSVREVLVSALDHLGGHRGEHGHCVPDRRSGESEPLPELLEINWKREIYVVFDSDLTLKPEIQSALKSLCKWLAERGGRPCVPRVVQIPCEFGGGKNGADDFIARHGSDAFFRLVRVAQPSGQWCWDGENNQWYFQFQWTPEPTNPHFVATPFWTVFKESYAEHPSFGTYKWLGTPLGSDGSAQATSSTNP